MSKPRSIHTLAAAWLAFSLVPLAPGLAWSAEAEEPAAAAASDEGAGSAEATSATTTEDGAEAKSNGAKEAAEGGEEEKSGPQFPGKFSGSVTLASDYVFRGVSQTLERPALQGELDWEHESGFHLGAWGSNVRFEDGDGSLEQDFYGGYETSLGDVSVNVEAYFYWYPSDESEYDYWEFPVELEYEAEPLTLSGSVSYSPDYYGYAGNAVYLNAGVAMELPLGDEAPVGISVDGTLGYTRAEYAVLTDRDYLDWTAGATISANGTWSGLGLGLHYTDSDIHGDDSDARFVATLGYEF
jgi:uncharacterized protein (TIGR02001 family)